MAGRPRVYSIDEAAEILAVGRTSIYKLVRRGTLTAIKIDGLRGMRIKADDLDAMIASARIVTPSELDAEDDGRPVRSRSRAVA